MRVEITARSRDEDEAREAGKGEDSEQKVQGQVEVVE